MWGTSAQNNGTLLKDVLSACEQITLVMKFPSWLADFKILDFSSSINVVTDVTSKLKTLTSLDMINLF